MRKKINKLFASLGSVRTVKNGDRVIENAARGRRPIAAFSRRFSIARKVTCHQSRHIARNITRQITRHIARLITLYITRQITLQRTRQITRNITRQIHRQITCHITRQIMIIIVSHGFVGTVAITYQVSITFSRKANLRLSLQHLYIYF